MRFAVQFQTNDKQWTVVDRIAASQIVGIHRSEDDAYKQAFAEQERWRKFDPVARQLGQSRAVYA